MTQLETLRALWWRTQNAIVSGKRGATEKRRQLTIITAGILAEQLKQERMRAA